MEIQIKKSMRYHRIHEFILGIQVHQDDYGQKYIYIYI